MMNLQQQAEYMAMEHRSEFLDAALKLLQDAQTKTAGSRGRVDQEAIAVLTDALHLRQVKERVDAAMAEVSEAWYE